MNKYSDKFILNLLNLAEEYVNECLSNTKDFVTNKGEVIQIQDRHLPTIQYFLNIWIPLIKKDKTIGRTTYYEWLKSEDKIKQNTIKKIEDLFHSLSKDIVANEGKGIFYAKNCLGMHDRQQIETREVDSFDFDK